MKGPFFGQAIEKESTRPENLQGAGLRDIPAFENRNTPVPPKAEFGYQDLWSLRYRAKVLGFARTECLISLSVVQPSMVESK